MKNIRNILLVTIPVFILGHTNIEIVICKKEQILTWHDSTHKSMKSESWYCNNMKDSIYKEWDNKGNIVQKGNYSMNNKHGLWEAIRYTANGDIYYHTYESFDKGKIIERRAYRVINNTELLNGIYSYSYLNIDTICVNRIFDITTGIIVQMDTLKNNRVNGTLKLWSPQDGFLYKEILADNGRIIHEKEFNRNGNIFIKTFNPNSTTKKELTYNCQGKLIEEKDYDEKGNLIKHKKKNKKK